MDDIQLDVIAGLTEKESESDKDVARAVDEAVQNRGSTTKDTAQQSDKFQTFCQKPENANEEKPRWN